MFRRAPAELNRRNLERFARVLRDEVAEGAVFQCLVTDDRELRRLNRAFRNKDYPTDVMSFPCGAGAPACPPALLAAQPSLGEIAISADRARAQAREYGHPVDAEICVLMLHGVLHLLGMDHETDRGRMARTEAGWRLRLALPAALTERARS